MSRQHAWFCSALIVGLLVMATLLVAANTHQLGFDSDDAVLTSLIGWL